MSGLEEPILSRINRLDNILKQLEDIRSINHSPKSSYASTTSSGTLTSDGHPSSFADFSPRGLGKHCRPVDEVMLEVERKGTLIDRLVHAEDRILKLCLQLEEEFEAEREKELTPSSDKSKSTPSTPKKGLKQLVKSCVRRKKHKDDV
ncbi:hypothetical protein PHJA_000629800 [Phtheirospermum japonicum]|uniref:Uncharacterized protein n=1 Tax=Phtheirospermum japonicum TaxID=374723 RepID=A0A830BB09_9LAMI|nr:hypothetical protein PHJA_000629800 [Phtheirospermum japonicum]